METRKSTRGEAKINMTTRQNLINEVIKVKPNLSPQDIAIAVDVVWNTIAKELVAGNRIEIRGFGSFGIRQRLLSARSSLPNRDASAGAKEIRTAYYRMSQNMFNKINS